MAESGAQFDKGPYLSAALLCERLLLEQDGVASAIRIIDRVTRTAVGTSPPEKMDPFEYDLTLVTILKAGWAQGAHAFRVALVSPLGESRNVVQQTAFFEGGEDRGVNIVGRMRIRFDLEGIYWFEVFLEDKPLTRIPLRIVYLRTVTPRSPGQSGFSPQRPESPTG